MARMKDGDVDGLAAQNAYLKEALETCRTQIFGLTQQVQHHPKARLSQMLCSCICVAFLGQVSAR